MDQKVCFFNISDEKWGVSSLYTVYVVPTMWTLAAASSRSSQLAVDIRYMAARVNKLKRALPTRSLLYKVHKQTLHYHKENYTNRMHTTRN